MNVQVYHYPKCSTSNAAISFLKSKNIAFETVLYCEKVLTKEEILNLMQMLGIFEIKNLIKRNGITYRHLGLAHKNLSDEEIIEVIIQNPKLLQRPIIICNNKAVIGKNEEIIENFLKSCQQ